jgi:hypothetical protein
MPPSLFRGFSDLDVRSATHAINILEKKMPKLFRSVMRRLGARRNNPTTRQFVEQMESRTHLSVSLNSAGWTVITPQAGDRIIYCSSSTGKDSNSGLSPSSPVQTLAHASALLRNHTGDELLLKAGDIFYGYFIFWSKSGASAQDPMVLGSYGTGSRPQIRTGVHSGLETGSSGAPVVSNIAIMGINFIADGRDPNLTKTPNTSKDPTGIDLLSGGSNILIENCELQYYDVDINLQDYLGSLNNISVRRNIVIDAYATNTHAEGLYATGVHGLNLDGNLFDQNGYNSQVAGAYATIYNHDCYLASTNTNVTIQNNIFARAANTGLQDRPGGIVKDNIFIDNPVGMMFGLVNGASTTPGGASGTVTDNIFIGGGNTGKTLGGQALEVGNIKPHSGTTISNNIFTQGGANSSPAIMLAYGSGQSDPQDSVGINDLTISQNIVYNWSAGFVVTGGQTPGGTGIKAFNDVTIASNEFENLTGPPVENHQANYSTQEHVSGNTYNNTKGWIVDYKYVPVIGTTLSKPFPFSAPTRNIASYDKSIGNSGSDADFLSHAQLQSESNWNAKLTAQAVYLYIAQGFM